MKNHDVFKAKNKSKQAEKEPKKLKTLAELIKSFPDIIPISDYLSQTKTSSNS